MHKKPAILAGWALASILLLASAASSPAVAEQPAYSLIIENGKFEPSTLTVEANVKFKLAVTNKMAKPAEFESAELNREKIVPAGRTIVIYIGPLAPGAYPFFDDFDHKNRGQIVAK